MLVVGSANSSNSKRLVEVGQNYGVQSYLVNDWSDVNPEWLINVTNVGVTAGASAPEHLVQQIVSALQSSGFRELEEVEMIEEDVRFSLPPELGQAAAQFVSITR
jgi:4-hydroxy-3-methylbut-2-enyl diphosphate reductase